MTDRMKRFADEYLVDLCAIRAYSIAYGRAGPSARSHASRLLDRPDVAQYIREAQGAARRRVQIRADAVLRELARVAFADAVDLVDRTTGEFLPPTHIPVDTRRAITSVRVRQCRDGVEIVAYRFGDKLSALTRIARHLGLLTENAVPPLEALLAGLPPDTRSEVIARLKEAEPAPAAPPPPSVPRGPIAAPPKRRRKRRSP